MSHPCGFVCLKCFMVSYKKLTVISQIMGALAFGESFGFLRHEILHVSMDLPDQFAGAC